MVEWVSRTQIPKWPGSNDLDTVRAVAISIKKLRKPIEKYVGLSYLEVKATIMELSTPTSFLTSWGGWWFIPKLFDPASTRGV